MLMQAPELSKRKETSVKIVRKLKFEWNARARMS